MKTKFYKVKSKGSKHKNHIGRYVGKFTENGEEYYTLRFGDPHHWKEFRSYPVRSLEIVKKSKFFNPLDWFRKIK